MHADSAYWTLPATTPAALLGLLLWGFTPWPARGLRVRADGLASEAFDLDGLFSSVDAPGPDDRDAYDRLMEEVLEPAPPEPERFESHPSKSRVAQAYREVQCNELWHLSLDPEALPNDPPPSAYSPWVTHLPVYYITMGGEKEAAFLASLGKFSPSVFRVQAVDGSDRALSDQLLLYPHMTVQKVFQMTEPEKRLGCLLSHLVAIKQAYDSGEQMALILEDDAVPLFASWRMTLEEYVSGLMPGWEASQLQWTVRGDRPVYFKHSSSVWETGSGWGTAAYLLHRRAMERIVRHTWDAGAAKFDLKYMVKTCFAMSADDCLMGFTDSHNYHELTQRYWLPDGSRMLNQVAKATPPLFLHDSRRTMSHRKNVCQDVSAAFSTSMRQAGIRREWQNTEGKTRVLAFLAYPPAQDAERDQGLRVLQANLRALRAASLGPELRVDTFVATRDAVGAAKAAVRPEEVLEGRAVQLLQRHWPHFHWAWTASYDFVWALDADIDISKTNLLYLFHLAQTSGARLVAPALVGAGSGQTDGFRTFERPATGCSFRKTSYVGAGAPIMAPASWHLLFGKCQHCLTQQSARSRGLDWCKFLDEKLGSERRQESSAACALLDAAAATREELLLPPDELEEAPPEKLWQECVRDAA